MWNNEELGKCQFESWYQSFHHESESNQTVVDIFLKVYGFIYGYIEPHLRSGSRRRAADARWRALWLHAGAGGVGEGGGGERRGGGGGGGEGGGRRCRALLLFRRLLSFCLRAFGQHPAGGMEPAGGFGAGKAGGVAFDPVAFFTHPRTVLRLMSWVSLPNTPSSSHLATCGCRQRSGLQPLHPASRSCRPWPNIPHQGKITDLYLFIFIIIAAGWARGAPLQGSRTQTPVGFVVQPMAGAPEAH